MLRFGEALPLMEANANRNPRFAFGALAGRYVLFCEVGDIEHVDAKAALAAIPLGKRDETRRMCVIMCTQAGALETPAMQPHAVMRLIFCDPAAAVASGLHDPSHPAGRWVLLDPSLRALGHWPLTEYSAALAALEQTPALDAALSAPALVVERIFEPHLCRTLIAYYERSGGQASGVALQDDAGKTFVQLDDGFKRRADATITDAALRAELDQCIWSRLAPEIAKAFMRRPTHIERHIVACYDAATGGYFRPHRDNTTTGTAHRQFAVTINLNAGEYDGGDLRFPEFGPRTYRAPTGGAVVFSCALLHEAMPVTRGKRFAFLPFLYDDAAARVREANRKMLEKSARRPSG